MVRAVTSFFRGVDNDTTEHPQGQIVPYSDDPEEFRRWLSSLDLEQLATMVRQETNRRVVAEAEHDRVRMIYEAALEAEATAKAWFRKECERRNLA